MKESKRTYGKFEIIRDVAQKTGLTQQESKSCVEAFLEVIKKILTDENRIEIRNFGVFDVKMTKPRTARDIKREKPIKIPARKKAVFKVSKIFLKELNGED